MALPLTLPTVSGPNFVSNVSSTDNQTKLNANFPERWFELTWNGRKLQYTIDIIDDGQQKQPKEGYPLYIGMHGGGTDWYEPPNENDVAWTGVEGIKDGWYRTPLMNWVQVQKKGACVLVCPRGIQTGPGIPHNTVHKDTDPNADEWNLQFQPEACILLERMLMNLLQVIPPEFAKYDGLKNYPRLESTRANFINPNLVYLWGFSAGGDGAFRVGTWIPDRFAAVIACAGESGETTFGNAANVPMLIEVGEDDYVQIPNDDTATTAATTYKWSRPKLNLERAQRSLATLHSSLQASDQASQYQYTCYVIKNIHRNDTGGEAYKHNWWQWPSHIDETLPTLKPAQYPVWLKQMQAIEDAGRKPPMIDLVATLGGRVEDYYDMTPTNPLRWLDAHTPKLARAATPKTVVWDLAWRPSDPVTNLQSSTVPPGWQKRFFYWLYLRKFPPTSPTTVKASVVQNGNAYAIHIPSPNPDIGYLLKANWIRNPLNVYVGIPETLVGNQLQVAVQPNIFSETLEARGDANLQFSAMIYLVPNGTTWTVQQAKSLKNPSL